MFDCFRHPVRQSLLASALALTGFLTLSVYSSPLHGDPVQTQAEAGDVTEEKVSRWVVQLNADIYEVRHEAQESLEQAGEIALPAVVETARGKSLESSTRAINILLFWAENAEYELRIAALQEIAKLPDHPREAALAKQLLIDAHEEAAIEELESLGAVCRRDPIYPLNSNVQIIIGPDWKGTNEQLELLAKVPRASTISFHCAPLKDEALRHIPKLEVHRIEFYGMDFSEEAVNKFRSQLVNPEMLEVRGGAMLGIQGIRSDGFALIRQVVVDSAADKAGLKEGDAITEFNGETITSFEDLTKRIATYEPGDTVVLSVLRQGKQNQPPEKVSVTFDQWGSPISNAPMQRTNLPIQVPSLEDIKPPRIERR